MMKKPALLCLLLISASAWAGNGSWDRPKDGYLIRLQDPMPIKQVGETTSLEGDVRLFEVEEDHNGDTTPIAKRLENEKIQLQFFFPDETVNVTSQVQLIPSSNKITFRFNSQPLQLGELNRLTVKLMTQSKAYEGLIQAKTRLELRLLDIDRRIADLLNQNQPKKVEALKKTKAVLLGVIADIDAKINRSQTMIAELKQPIIVGNLSATESRLMTQMGGFLFESTFTPGTTTDGGKALIHSKITRVKEYASTYKKDWTIHYQFLNQSIGNQSVDGWSEGQSISFDYEKTGLNSNQNALAFFKTTIKRKNKLWGYSEFKLPIPTDLVTPVWAAQSTPYSWKRYVKSFEPLSAVATDAFGLLDVSSLEAKLNGSDIKSQLTVTANSSQSQVQVSGDLNSMGLPDGDYTLSLSVKDGAGHAAQPNPFTAQVQLDRIAPAVQLILNQEPPYRDAVQGLNLVVSDASPVQTTVKLNGENLYSGPTSIISLNYSLQQGFNIIEVTATDAAGNFTSVTRADLFVDSIQPQFTALSPSAGAVFSTLSIPISGSVSEPLLFAKVNGQMLTLSEDKKSFSGVFVSQMGGQVLLHFEIADLVGNLHETNRPVTVIVDILNENLLSVMPDPDGLHLIIRGANFTTTPGARITAAGSFFNSASGIADQNGAFSLRLDLFTEAEVTATDDSLGRTDTALVRWGIGGGTLLSGVVKDVGDSTTGTAPQPLAGVKVSLSTGGESVFTNEDGVFAFTKPMIGDQTLIVDGSTAVQSPEPAARRIFGKTAIAITVGLSQNNVLNRPIYLVPTPNTLSVPEVDASVGATVTSNDAPGVILDIPANTAEFPGGQAEAKVYMRTLPAEVATVVPPEVSIPTKVIALEPSGTTFKKPVQITLPNDSELPPNTEVVILSMSSETGQWELGASAKVSADGSKIVTKENSGLRHFSIIYSSPLGPTVKQIGSQDQPGSDTFNGALTTSVKLPTYKALGKDVGASLIYRSNWAKPTVTVTNLFDLPTYEVKLSIPDDVGTSRNVPYQASVKRCAFLFFGCRDEMDTFYADFNYRIQTDLNSIVRPDKILAQFFSGPIVSEVMTFTGIPDRANISYAMDLKDPDTGKYFESGVVPYRSHYTVHYKENIVGTRSTAISNDNLLRDGPKITVENVNITRELDKVFPQDLAGPLYVQNESKSSYGQGWKLGGVQRLPQTTGDRIMLEEADGSISSYAAKNTITTVYDGNTYPGDTQGAAINAWPYFYINDLNTQEILKVRADGDTPQVSVYGQDVLSYAGRASGYDTYDFFDGQRYCRYASFNYAMNSYSVEKIVMPDGSIYGTNINKHFIFKVNPGAEASVISGNRAQVPLFGNFHGFHPNSSNNAEARITNFLANRGMFIWPTTASPANFSVPNGGVEGQACPPIQTPSTGYYGIPNGGAPLSADFNVGANKPLGITVGPRPNTIVFADYGIHSVRMLDLSTGESRRIAGNGMALDTGDGGYATEAGIYHPRGVTYDSQGNLYISTENGLIRKVDTTGKISTIAGKPNIPGQSLIFGNSAPMDRVSLSTPFGMVIDEAKGFLYVADTYHHRIIRLEFFTGLASVVSGDGAPGYNGDNIPAIDAKLNTPMLLALDDQKNLIVTDAANNRIRRIVFGSSSNGTLAYQPANKDLSQLTRQSDGSWVRAYRDGTQILFNALGLHTLSQDRVGRQTKYFYDGDNRLVQIMDPTGQSTYMDYSGHYLTRITDPAQRETQFSYNGAGQLTQIRFPDNSTRHYEYDVQGLMVAETDPRGNSTTYSYNEWNRLASVKRPDNTELKVNDSASSTIGNNFTSGATGELKTTGLENNKVHDGISDAKNVETKFVKDFNGQVTTIVDGMGRTTEIKRNLAGQTTELTRSDGSKATYEYDPVTQDLLKQTDTALGLSASQTFDEFGNKLTETNSRGKTTTHEYDSRGLKISVTNPLNQRSSVTYNSLGQPITATNTLGKTSVTTYDSKGNALTQTDPVGRTSHFTYDLAGNILTSTDSGGKITRYEYDTINRLKAVVTPKNERTEYAYLPSGELLTITDHLGSQISFEYNFMGQMIKKTDQLGFAIMREYDPNGNVSKEIDPNGNVKLFSYDNSNQITQKLLPDNVINITRDDQGNTSRIVDNYSELSYDFDVAGRMTQSSFQGRGPASSLPAVMLTHDRDSNGNRTALHDPVGATWFRYDDLDRLTSLTNPKGEIYAFGYDSGSRLVSMSRPGSESTFNFDDSNMVSSIVHSRGSVNVASFGLSRNLAGLITEINRNQSISKIYGYDDNSQLVSATNPEATVPSQMQNEAFGYDAIYNRTQDQKGSYTFDSKHQRLEQDYRFFYYYDNNGNMVKKQEKANFPNSAVTNFDYSSENQLVGFKVYDSGNPNPVKEVWYMYDAVGRRIQKQVIDRTAENDPKKTFMRRYVYDGAEILLEYDGTNTLLARYTHSGLRTDDILAADITSAGVTAEIAQNSGSYQYLKDHQGTISDVTDSAGNKLQQYVYSAFGVLLGIQDANAADITPNPALNTSFTFTGREYDSESGYYYYRARYYDANMGRFLQKDPSPGRLSISASIVNAYIYGINSPLMHTDPTGKSFLDDFFKVIIGIGAIVVGAIVGPIVAAAAGLTGLASVLASAIVGAAAGGIFAGGAFALTGIGTFDQGFNFGAGLGFGGGLAAAFFFPSGISQSLFSGGTKTLTGFVGTSGAQSIILGSLTVDLVPLVCPSVVGSNPDSSLGQVCRDGIGDTSSPPLPDPPSP